MVTSAKVDAITRALIGEGASEQQSKSAAELARVSHDRLCRGATRYGQASRRRPLGLGLNSSDMKKYFPAQPWTSEDEARLRALAGAGRSAATIAERLKRTINAVRFKARTLNVMLRRAGRAPKAAGKK